MPDESEYHKNRFVIIMDSSAKRRQILSFRQMPET